jgi:hypothetical protein
MKKMGTEKATGEKYASKAAMAKQMKEKVAAKKTMIKKKK